MAPNATFWLENIRIYAGVDRDCDNQIKLHRLSGGVKKNRYNKDFAPAPE